MAEKPIEPDFTIGDILREFEDDFGPPQIPISAEDCYTTGELCGIYGIADSTVRKKLKRLKMEGRLIETTKSVEILGRPNITYPAPAYQIKEKTDGQD